MMVSWTILLGAALAHGPSEDRVVVRLSGASARVAATVPASFFAEADDDRDGRLSADEVAAHRQTILARGVAAFVLTDGAGARPEEVLLDAVLPGAELDGAAHLTLVMAHRFPQAPQAVDLQVTLPEDAGLLELVWQDADSGARAGAHLSAGVQAVRLRAGS